MNFIDSMEGNNWSEDPLRFCEFSKIYDLIKEFPGPSGPDLDYLYRNKNSKTFDFDILFGAGAANNPWPDPKKRKYWKPKRKNILLDYECTAGWDNWENDFNKILHICPYTADWRNKILKTEKYKFVYFPISPRFFPTDITRTFEKRYDVIYSGHFNSMEMDKELILPMKNFNYVTVSRKDCSLTGVHTTHKGVSYKEKMMLYGLSKVSIIHNAYWNVSGLHRDQFANSKNWKKNFAFSEIISNNPNVGTRMVPQLKSRTFEAAAGRSLMLVRKDSFNIIEHFFKEGEDFIYFEKGELNSKLSHILENYCDYIDIINSAYYKVRNKYTTLNFFKDFIVPFAKEK